MKKHTFATIAASALAALSIGLAAPAFAAPSGPNDDTNVPGPQTGSNSSANAWWTNAGQNAYGTYQNDHNRGSRR